MKRKEKLFAVAFGKGYQDDPDSPGDLEGDSGWSATLSFPYKEGMTPTELYDATIRCYYETYNGCGAKYEDEMEWFEVEGDMFTDPNGDILTGWWIISENTKKIITATANAMPPAGNDSVCYEQGQTLKAIAKAGAIKTLKSRGLPAKYRRLIEESELHNGY